MAAAADALAAALLRLCVIEDGSAAWADALAAVQSALAGCDSAGDASSAALAQATRDLCACAWDSDTWADARAVLADVLGQGNTYLTWSLALPSHRHETLLLAPGEGDSILEVTPASLGIHQGLSPQALKALDLGGGDQRLIRAALEAGAREGAHRILQSNHDAARQKKNPEAPATAAAAPVAVPAKAPMPTCAPEPAAAAAAPSGNVSPGSAISGRLRSLNGEDLPRLHILTGGDLPTRLLAASLLAASFPETTCVTLSPATEGRLTMAAGEEEMLRLIHSSGGLITHALMIAKGSTDLHLCWLSSSGPPATAGTSLSAMHRPFASAPSTAANLFLAFLSAPPNAPLRAAAARGACALIFAGAAVHAFGGEEVAARGCYFRRVPLRRLQEADAARAQFERFVSLDWNASVSGGQSAAGGSGQPSSRGGSGTAGGGGLAEGPVRGGVGSESTSERAVAQVGGVSCAEGEVRPRGGRGEGAGSLQGLRDGAGLHVNPVFVGALGMSKPRLNDV